MKLFDVFKQYIVKHPRVAAYKPTSNKYDRNQLFDIKGTEGQVPVSDRI